MGMKEYSDSSFLTSIPTENFARPLCFVVKKDVQKESGSGEEPLLSN